jgi:YegS/Rv2252/BmrU family lipid kinase
LELRATLFVNPTAGGGKCGKRYPLVAKTLRDAGMACDVMLSQYPGHITQVSSDLAARGEDTVIACGGDGTLNEIINGIAGTQTAVGIIPLGAANCLAGEFGIDKDIEAACRIIKTGQAQKVDLVKINDDKLFAGVGCVGFDSEAAAFANGRRREKSNPFLLHLVGSALKVFSYQAKTVELRFNGDRYFGEVLLVAFGNGRFYSQPMPSSTATVTDDGSLYVYVVRPMPKWKLLSRFPSVSKKVNPNNKEVTVHRTVSVHVQSLGPMELYADGDFITTTPFRLQIMPKHLKVIVGPSS